jgi:hypothetical protein
MKKTSVCEGQITIFDILKDIKEKIEFAVSLFDNKERELRPVEPWMRQVVPEAEYAMACDNHTLVLHKSNDIISPEMRYRYYRVGDTIYAATGID